MKSQISPESMRSNATRAKKRGLPRVSAVILLHILHPDISNWIKYVDCRWIRGKKAGHSIPRPYVTVHKIWTWTRGTLLLLHSNITRNLSVRYEKPPVQVPRYVSAYDQYSGEQFIWSSGFVFSRSFRFTSSNIRRGERLIWVSHNPLQWGRI